MTSMHCTLVPPPPPPFYGVCMEDTTSLGYACGSGVESDMAAKPILAERYKTKFCRNYVLTGICPYQRRCMFAHGDHELRTPEMNINDGLVTEEAIRLFRRQFLSDICAFDRPRRRGFPAPPYFYHAMGVCVSDRGVPVRIAPAKIYTHNPYKSDIIPLQSRLYSQPPALAMMTAATVMPQYYEEGTMCRSSCDPSENQDDFEPCVEIISSPRCYACNESDDAEPSACSSIGSDSEDNRQSTPCKEYINESMPSEEVMSGEAALQ
ncbi:zinc finger CCCH domain containing protein 11 [Trypanosoma cruzi]|uniref:C3H1-type domain-containing protein n=2 Tax=Trypanosoma cruzi TaxID=5693 RepID=Q4CQE4_TRYCC|nr:hypothetical protein, conserved [Trypanosoma cruzi]EAN82498.1 hypothetical protein, conserved [Trypanosoma cruzi]PWV12353.1 zinc finger CCCH domain containing protein 11 [Trypanosoma cruzi]|eukprot:XP_804349.1 hypothetical protein [Trypanosoma cruzi strain CL Brener]